MNPMAHTTASLEASTRYNGIFRSKLIGFDKHQHNDREPSDLFAKRL